MDFINSFFYSLLTIFYNYFNSYTLSVIFVTLIIKLIMMPLNVKQYVSGYITDYVDKEIATTVANSNDFNDEKQRKEYIHSQRNILLKKYSINQLRSCLFSLFALAIQIILLLSFYAVIKNNSLIAEERFFWFSLGEVDKTFILPILTGIANLIYVFLSSRYKEKKKTGYIFGGLFSLVILIFGFTVSSVIYLYWLIGNIFSVIIVLYSQFITQKILVNPKLKSYN